MRLVAALLPLLVLAPAPANAQDEALPWSRKYTVVSENFRVHTNLPRTRAEAFSKLLERLHATFQETCARPLHLADLDVRLDVYVFAGEDDFRAYARRHLPGAEGAPGLFDVGTKASYFADREDVPGTTTVREVLLHEGAHHLWWAYAGRPEASSASRALYWISEGFANWFETMDDAGQVHPRTSLRWERAAEAVRADRLPSLDAFEGFSQRSLDHPEAERRRDHHAQATTLIDFLLATRDGEHRLALLRTALDVERGRGERALFRRRFGAPLRSFEEDWKAHVLAVPAGAAGAKVEAEPGPEIRIPVRRDDEFWRRVAAGGLDDRVLDPAGVDEEVALREAAGSGARVLRTGHYLFVSDAPEARLAEIGAMAERWYGAFATHFGVEVDPLVLLRRMNMRRDVLGQPLRRNETMKVAVFLSTGRYDAFLARYCEGRMKGGAGFTDPATTTSIVRRVAGSELSLEATLAHELGHLFVEAAYGRAVQGSVPAWISEGAATWFETLRPSGEGAGEVNRYRLEAVRPASLRLESLIEAGPEAADGASGHRFYAEGWALYHFSRRGPEVWRDRFATYEDAVYRAYFADPAEAAREGARMFREAFGGDLSALEKDLRAHVRKLQAD